jgi:hypothetical protein
MEHWGDVETYVKALKTKGIAPASVQHLSVLLYGATEITKPQPATAASAAVPSLTKVYPPLKEVLLVELAAVVDFANAWVVTTYEVRTQRHCAFFHPHALVPLLLSG